VRVVYDTVIPRNVARLRAPSHGKPVLLYDFRLPRPRPISTWRARCCGASRRAGVIRGLGLSSGGGMGQAAAGIHGGGGSERGRTAAQPRPPRPLRALREESEDYAALDRLRQAKTVPIDFVPVLSRAAISMRSRCRRSPSRSARRGAPARSWCGAHPEDASAYEIIAGERRWRARKSPSCTRFRSSSASSTIARRSRFALVENVQRQD